MTVLRVGHLIKGLGRGGAETLLPHLARAMSGTVDTHVAYFLPWKDALASEVRAAGSSVTCFDASSSLQMLIRWRAVRRWARDHQLDLVHCHLPMAGVTGRLALWGSGIPLVYTEHNMQERYRVGTRWLNRATWRLQDHVVAVSDEVSRSIARHLPATVAVDVVRNGIPDLPLMCWDRRGDVRQAAGLEDVPVVGTIAVFRGQKRLDLWLRVARRVREKMPAARFLIVGDGPLRAELERRVHEEGLHGSVLMPGLQSDILPWLACMDVFLMTSEFEGLPLALLEAMMTGRPVVATSVGGIPEVIDDGEDGYITDFGSTEVQVDRVVTLLASPEHRERIGRAARQKVQERYGIARMARQLLDIYESLLVQRVGMTRVGSGGR